MTHAPAATDGLEQSVGRGFRWSLAGRVLTKVGRMVAMVALARILTPADFGLYATALVVSDVLVMTAGLGMHEAVVRWRDDDAALGTATAIAIGWSLLLGSLALVGAAPLATVLGNPEAAGVLRVMALAVPVGGVLAVPAGILLRGFRQDRRAVADLVGLVANLGLAVGLALLGRGAVSLAIGQVAGVVVTTAIVVHAAGLPRPRLDVAVARRLLRYGLPLGGAALLHFLLLNVDYVVLGRATDPAVLGAYLIAFNLASFPLNMIRDAVRTVAIPAFAELDATGERVHEAFLDGLGRAVAVSGVLGLGLVLLADPALGLLYGQKWAAAAAPLRWLAVLAVTRMVIHLGEDLLTAIGRTRSLVALQAGWLLVATPALALGVSRGGAAGVGQAHVATSLLVAAAVLALLRHHVGLTPRQVAGALARPALGLAAAAVVGLAVRARVDGILPQLLAVGPTVLATHLLVVWPVLRPRTTPPSSSTGATVPTPRPTPQPTATDRGRRPAPTLVSVVIPCFNATSTLGAQLDALARQDPGCDWEVLVVDNRSTDGTAELALGHVGRLPIRVVAATERASAGYARQVGLEDAKGDLLVFCDADDVVADGWLAALVDAARGHDVVQGRFDEVSLNPPEVRAAHTPLPDDDLPVTMGHRYVVSANMAMWRDAFEAIGGWPDLRGAAGEDLELSLLAHRAGLSLGFAADAVIAYRYRADTRSMARQHFHYAKVEPRLYRRYRDDLVRPRRLRDTAWTWGWLVVHLPDLFSRERRGGWVRHAAVAAGLLAGSVEHRVLYV